MSYQVLARKWRPSSFSQMVGQEHVLRALVNALDDGRLHHAYLFTGTRGVGKTSLARLFAKSLNCEQGVSSTPCGACSPCQEIAEGRFVDLIEVDAASRTKVEDTRELLENVQYAPTRGRYKIYLIDEVHMLSSHSFNALLKTLEEPPPHVKFLLATTDPQKLPITILSRCLQFNLKNMTPERITEHLKQVLDAEQVPYEEAALWLLSRAADGSMRDALSLTDQAIAFGAGAVREAEVRAMLGSIDQGLVCRLLQAVGSQDANQVLSTVAQLADHAPDYDGVMAELLNLLHRVAVAQLLPGSVDNSLGDQAEITALAGSLRAEDVQLYYQVALNGRRDLPLVPNPRDGLEMTLLRMLAFRPVGAGQVAVPVQPPATAGGNVQEEEQAAPASGGPERTARAAGEEAAQDSASQHRLQSETTAATATPQAHRAAGAAGSPVGGDPRPGQRADAAEPQSELPPREAGASAQGAPMASETADPPPYDDEPPPWGEPQPSPRPAPPAGGQPGAPAPPASKKPEPAAEKRLQTPAEEQGEPASRRSLPAANVSRPADSTVPGSTDQLQPDHWFALLSELDLAGMTYNIAANAALVSVEGNRLLFELAEGQMHLLTPTHEARITSALEGFFQTAVEISVAGVPAPSRETPRQYLERRRAERLAEAIGAMESDQVVQALLTRFDGELDRASIQPVDPET